METKKSGKRFRRIQISKQIHFTIRNDLLKSDTFGGFQVRFLEEGISLVHPVTNELLVRDPRFPLEGILPLEYVKKNKELYHLWKIEREAIDGECHN